MRFDVNLVSSVVARRIFGLFVICALLPICALALLSLNHVSKVLKEETHARLHHVGKNAGMAIIEGLQQLQGELEIMLGSPDSRASVATSLHLDVSMLNKKHFRAVTYFTASGKHLRIIGPDSPQPELSEDARQALATGKTMIYNVQQPGTPTRIFMVLPRGGKKGLLVAELNTDFLWELVQRTLPPNTHISVLNLAGHQLYTTTELSSQAMDDLRRENNHSSSGRFTWQKGTRTYLANYWSVFLRSAFLADPLTVVVSESKDIALQPLSSFVRTFVLVLLLTLLIIIFISSIQIRQSLTPLTILKKSANRISEGDFSGQVILKSRDEFEALGDAFNTMTNHLGKQFQSLIEMGTIVRKILAARSQEEIAQEVLGNLRTLIPFDWAGLALFDATVIDMATTYYTRADDVSEKPAQQIMNFGTEELLLLQSTGDTLHVAKPEEFPTLMTPMLTAGCRSISLAPILLKDQLLGVLALGFREPAEQDSKSRERLHQVADQIGVSLENIRLIRELDQLNWGTVTALASAVDAKSPWTAGHSERVTQLAVRIGTALGLDEHSLATLHLGGLFHDIGKLGVPETVLDKPGKLTESEYELVKGHPVKGAEIIRHIEAYRDVIPIVVEHHEWFDGQGYPKGLAGDAISLGARILAVADVYDALASDRPYRKGWETEKVRDYLIEKSGSQFDPEVVATFMTILSEGENSRTDWHIPDSGLSRAMGIS